MTFQICGQVREYNMAGRHQDWEGERVLEQHCQRQLWRCDRRDGNRSKTPVACYATDRKQFWTACRRSGHRVEREGSGKPGVSDFDVCYSNIVPEDRVESDGFSWNSVVNYLCRKDFDFTSWFRGRIVPCLDRIIISRHLVQSRLRLAYNEWIPAACARLGTAAKLLSSTKPLPGSSAIRSQCLVSGVGCSRWRYPFSRT